MLTVGKYDHPSAWDTSTVQGKEDIAYTLGDLHLRAFDRALDWVRSKGLDLESVKRTDFPLDDIEDSVASWINEVQEGQGLILLQGFPIDRYSQKERELIYWGIGAHFGEAQSQSLSGDRLGHVVNLGGDDTRYRAYQNSTELALHTDATDIVGMMCLVPAKNGGLSGYASGPAIYNYLVEHEPTVLATLCDGFHYHLFGEQGPGESPVTEQKIPVFTEAGGYLSTSYLRSYIELAYGEMSCAKTEAEQLALDTIDRIAHSKEFYCQFMMEPGEMLFFNNYVVLHNRTAFSDHEEAGKRRHLMRLWLRAHEPRPVSELASPFNRRSGIRKQAGRRSFYLGATEYQEYAPPASGDGPH